MSNSILFSTISAVNPNNSIENTLEYFHFSTFLSHCSYCFIVFNLNIDIAVISLLKYGMQRSGKFALSPLRREGKQSQHLCDCFREVAINLCSSGHDIILIVDSTKFLNLPQQKNLITLLLDSLIVQ